VVLTPAAACCLLLPYTHPSNTTTLILTAVAVLDVQLPKDYVCKCQCAVRLKITLPAAGCSYEGPSPVVIFSSGFQVRSLCCLGHQMTDHCSAWFIACTPGAC
jgi:hypothetical protein